MAVLLGWPITNHHNVRSANLNFHIPQAGILHGFAGYFESVLYGDVCLSIHPDTKDALSPNMLSWFPIFFPLKVVFPLCFLMAFSYLTPHGRIHYTFPLTASFRCPYGA